MISGQWIFSILRRQLFINTWTLLMIVAVVLKVSAPYNRTVSTFVLKILTLILVDNCFELHMFFNCRNNVLAFSILAFTSASDSPCSSMMLPRWVRESFHLIQNFSIKCDWVCVLRVVFEDLAFSLVYVEAY
ncbi:unnamed protein product [Schistosoma margrebowiei]|uniref:Uncharacterized protein n=1 Tax=Schistosoma margrebowiei TaxID=48269 RepID=A0A183LM86_9TREM|nr:unnamed protein product [Schistosoma margrebowiei]